MSVSDPNMAMNRAPRRSSADECTFIPKTKCKQQTRFFTKSNERREKIKAVAANCWHGVTTPTEAHKNAAEVNVDDVEWIFKVFSSRPKLTSENERETQLRLGTRIDVSA